MIGVMIWNNMTEEADFNACVTVEKANELKQWVKDSNTDLGSEIFVYKEVYYSA